MEDNIKKIKTESKFYKLERLLKWEHREQVDNYLMSGSMSPHKLTIWCKNMGFDISKQKLYDYKELLQRAAAQQVTVEYLLGIGEHRRTPTILKTLGVGEPMTLVKSEMEVLDTVIQMGFNCLLTNKVVSIQDTIKAIDMKNKLTDGAHGGLTGYGLDQLRELEEAKFGAIIQVMMRYLPEDKLEEVQEAIEIAERDFYSTYAPQYLDDYDMEMQRRMEDAGTRSEIVVTDGY